MKTQHTNKINLKKLTIARISIDGLKNIKGGSSIPTRRVNEGPFDDGICYEVH